MRLENMRMYQAAQSLSLEIDRLLPRARRVARGPADHLERATDSILFNMAEGIGAFKPKPKIAAYDIARREASEVRAALHRLVLRGVFPRAAVQRADSLAGSCIAMLTSAMIALEKRNDGN